MFAPPWLDEFFSIIHSQLHVPMETTSYGEAWRAFQKQNFGLCSTTYYSTVPITCTQTRIHRTQSLHYDKLLKRNSLWHLYNKLRCNDISWWYIVLLWEISLQRSLARIISRRDIAKIVPISHWFIVLMFGNPCDVSLIYRWSIARTKYDIRRLLFALLLHSTVQLQLINRAITC